MGKQARENVLRNGEQIVLKMCLGTAQPYIMEGMSF
jgi:hypothetical protein